MTIKNNHTDLVEELAALAPLHFVGVNGSGMRPLAEFVATFGCAVTGSDLTPAFGRSLVKFAAEGSPEDLDLIAKAGTIVFSSAIPEGHPTLREASLRAKVTLHRSLLLARITSAFKTIAVAGTHGKSTTSALVAHGLGGLGLDPSWIIGAPFADGRSSYHRGKGELLVIEADESDGSFLRYSPFIAVLNNIEPDHMDFYQTIERLEGAFGSYAANVCAEGTLVYWQDSPSVARAIAGFSGKRLSFGETVGSDLRLLETATSGLKTTATFLNHGSRRQFKLPLPGRHNVLNGLAAICVLLLLDQPAETSCLALESFPGIERRLQPYTSVSGALIFDDYAHNPGKIRSLLAGLTDAFPERRVVAVFQPHRYSRISSLYEDFVTAFKGKSVVVVVLPVYAAGEPVISGYEAETIARDISKGSGAKTFFAPTLKAGADLVKSIIDLNNDLVVTIGAGDVWLVAKDLSERR